MPRPADPVRISTAAKRTHTHRDLIEGRCTSEEYVAAHALVQEAARELSEAAYEWWSCLRPVDWAEAEHIAEPTVNCANDRERDLALALVALLRSERDDV